MSVSPDFSERRGEALSGIEIPSVLGGASPLPDLSPQFSDDWSYQYFIVVPMSMIKQYNHETVNTIICRVIVKQIGEYDGESFPPVLESWHNPASICYKVTCTRKTFEAVYREAVSVYTDFGGRAEVMMYYQTSGVMQ